VRPETLDNKSLERVLSERGREVGLESSKSAYKQAMLGWKAVWREGNVHQKSPWITTQTLY
jgi:hypothetical protein